MCLCVYGCLHACMPVCLVLSWCICACGRVSIHARMYACKCKCMYVSMHICMYASMHVCIFLYYAYIHVCMYAHVRWCIMYVSYYNTYVYMFMCVTMWMIVWMYACILVGREVGTYAWMCKYVNICGSICMLYMQRFCCYCCCCCCCCRLVLSCVCNEWWDEGWKGAEDRRYAFTERAIYRTDFWVAVVAVVVAVVAAHLWTDSAPVWWPGW